jgi:hypothetical protein
MKDDGEEKKGAALLLEKYVERSPAERGKIVGAVLLTSLLIAWGSFVDPGSASLKKAGAIQKRIAAHEAKIDRSKVEVPDSNVEARKEAGRLESEAQAAEERIAEATRSSGAGPDLPAVVARAAGSELVSVSSDGPGWPVQNHDGRWIHLVRIKVASSDWSALRESLRAAEKAAGPTARPRALDVGASDDGRTAARAEWVVIGPDRDWIGHPASARKEGGL